MPTIIDDWTLHEPPANPRDTDIRRSPSPGRSSTPFPPPSPAPVGSGFLGWLGQMQPTFRVPPPPVHGRGRPLTNDWHYAAVPHSSTLPAAGLAPDTPADMNRNDNPWLAYPRAVTRTQTMPLVVHSPAAVPPLATSRPAPPHPLPPPPLLDATTTTATTTTTLPPPLFPPATLPTTRQRSQTPPRRNIRPRPRPRPRPQQQRLDPADPLPPTQLTAAALLQHEAATDTPLPPWRQARPAASAAATAGGYGDPNPYAAPVQQRLATIADTPEWQQEQEAREMEEVIRMYEVTAGSSSSVDNMPPSPPPPEPQQTPTLRRLGLTPQPADTPPSHPRPRWPLHPPCRCRTTLPTTTTPQGQPAAMAGPPPPPQPERIPTPGTAGLPPQVAQLPSYSHPTTTDQRPGPAPTALTAAALRQHDALHPWPPPGRVSSPASTAEGERVPPTPALPRAGGWGGSSWPPPPPLRASPREAPLVPVPPDWELESEYAARWAGEMLLAHLIGRPAVGEVSVRRSGRVGSGMPLAGAAAAPSEPEVEEEEEPTLLGTAEMLEGLAAELVRGGGVCAAWGGVERALGALRGLHAARGAKLSAEVVVGAVAGGCVLCYMRVADSVFRPCGHLVLCAECVRAERVGGGPGSEWPTVRCPVGRCGAEVVAVVKAYRG